MRMFMSLLVRGAAKQAHMVHSAPDSAKRAFVGVLLATARVFGVPLTVTRESDDKVLVSAYRRVAKKAHLDKGGNTRAFQKLQGARDARDAARTSSQASGGRPKKPAAGSSRAAAIARLRA